MLIGDSGTGKTPSINEPMLPIKRNKQFLDDHLKDYANYQTVLELYGIALKTLKANLKDCKDNHKKESTRKEIEEFKKAKPQTIF